MKKIWLLVLTIAVCTMCMFAASACSSGDKYGEAGTYYDLNSGNTFYFDGNGKCDYAGINCTYYIEDSIYYYISHGDTTLTYKKVNDGVLVETFKNAPLYLSITASSSNGRISGNITYGSTLIYFYIDGTYQEFSEYTLVGTGNYYFNEGVLVQEQTLGMTSGGSWSSNIVYYGYYVNEETGQLSGVMLADPDHYKQWHSDNNNNGETEDDNEDDIPVYTPHTLTYDLNYDGAPLVTQQVIKGENVNIIAPERRGYEFSGWYYNGDKITDGVWKYDGDITLTARWEIIYYSVTYNTDGGTMPDSYMRTFTAESELPYTLPVPKKLGYDFAGWYENADLSGQSITEIPENGLRDYTLYAKYTVDHTPHTLTYDLNYNGAPTTTQQVVTGENVKLITPERRGYEFSGWYYNGNKITDGVWKYDGDITLTALWKIINYSVTYDTDGGTMPDNHMETFTVESNLPYTLPIPVKQGYNFAGWYENADLSGQPITEIPENGLRDYTLYAKYTDEPLLEFELSFDETYYCVVGYKGSPQYITIPDMNDGLPVKEISAKAFYGCDTLISITLPDGITAIGNNAFYSCGKLASIVIPDSVTTIGDSAFSYCDSLTGITIPDSVTTIGNSAFSYCDSLTSVTIGNSVTTIGDSAFYYCNNLTSVTIGNSVTTIGDSAFSYCRSLTSITIPDSVTTIGNSAFSSCSSLTSIVIPDSVTTIGNSAFSSCSSLTSIVIPDSVRSIGSYAFPEHLCKRYGDCYYLPTKNSEYGFLYAPIDRDIVNVRIHADCKAINAGAFSSCDNLTSITIPDSVTTIGDRAFYYCNNLTSITIPDSVTTIGEWAFYDCYNLTIVTIGNSVTTIGDEAFRDCDSLTSITIPDSVTTIGDGAFRDCNNLTSATIGNSVTTIGNSAFSSCSSLTSIVIPDSVTTIGDSAFSWCTNLSIIFYKGSAESWDDITFGEYALSGGKVYYFTETEPTDDGNYWHYDTDGKTPVIW